MTRRDVAALVVRMAVENPQWGYTRIRGALSNLGHEIARTPVSGSGTTTGSSRLPSGGYVAYCVQKLLSRKSGHGTRLLVEVDLLTKE